MTEVLSSDWFVNSFIMVACENILVVLWPENTNWLNLKKNFLIVNH